MFEYEKIGSGRAASSGLHALDIRPDELEIRLVEIGQTTRHTFTHQPLDRDRARLNTLRQTHRHSFYGLESRLFNRRFRRVHCQPMKHGPQRFEVVFVRVRIVDARAGRVGVERVEVSVVGVRVELVEEQIDSVIGESRCRGETRAQRTNQVLFGNREILIFWLQIKD